MTWNKFYAQNIKSDFVAIVPSSTFSHIFKTSPSAQHCVQHSFPFPSAASTATSHFGICARNRSSVSRPMTITAPCDKDNEERREKIIIKRDHRLSFCSVGDFYRDAEHEHDTLCAHTDTASHIPTHTGGERRRDFMMYENGNHRTKRKILKTTTIIMCCFRFAFTCCCCIACCVVRRCTREIQENGGVYSMLFNDASSVYDTIYTSSLRCRQNRKF